MVFLPVNNALSPAGHVAQYLEQMGQGVQHVASRVDDLVALVDRANELRDATGEGLAFLNVPRSYYGDLPDAATLARRSGASLEDAEAALDALRAAGAVDAAGLVDLELDAARAEMLVGDGAIAAAVAASRYANLKDMLGNEFDAVPKPNLQPDFKVSVFECFDKISSAGLRELDESDRPVQKSAESTSI